VTELVQPPVRPKAEAGKTTMTEETTGVSPTPEPGPDALEHGGAKMSTRGVDVFYNEAQALFGVDLDIPSNRVTALIGPSGCGKSTYLRCLNRMNDTIEGCRVVGSVALDGEDIYAPAVDVVQLRARIGMVFQKPNPFPKSIFDNVAYGP